MWDEKVYKFIKREFEEEEVTEDRTENEIRILALRNWSRPEIEYGIMQGRPSMKMKIQEKEWDCLLDTGARINVMSNGIFRQLENVVLTATDDRLRCANDSKLEILGKIQVEVIIGDKVEIVTFIVVDKIIPDIIGGIELQKQFGMELQWLEERRKQKREFISNIEARFGRKIDSKERFLRAATVLKVKEFPRLEAIIKEKADVFMTDNWDIGCTHLTKHKIMTRGEPINIKPWRQPMNLEAKIDEAIKNLYENGIIRKCNSPWNTPLIVVWKKEKKDVRLCLDFRRLNAITERQAFPMPSVDEMLDTLNGAKYFTSIDLGNAYYQVELEEESQEKTAFSTKTGQYCFKRMPFGIAAAPGTFQELMTEVLKGIKSATVYLADILVFTESKEEHFEILEEVLERIRQAGLRMNPEKCQVFRTEVKYLGHIISKDGIQTDPSKLTPIQSFERPKCVKNLRSFLGICNYYRKFIKEYAKKSRALEQLCGLNIKNWFGQKSVKRHSRK